VLDDFEVLIKPHPFVHRPDGHGFQPATVRINGRPLIELVRAAEEPWAKAEYLERLPEFENPDGFRFVPGDYHYLPAHRVLLPSREWLGEPSEPGFVLDADDPRRNKATVLGCTCGIIQCWFLQVRVQVLPEVIVWSDFGQFHRPHWRYDLGPFTFDRRDYEAQLAQRA